MGSGVFVAWVRSWDPLLKSDFRVGLGASVGLCSGIVRERSSESLLLSLGLLLVGFVGDQVVRVDVVCVDWEVVPSGWCDVVVFPITGV